MASSGESNDKLYKLRFRHLSGDVGPLTFQESSAVLAMKNSIWENWPTEEPLCSQKPESIQYFRIMYQGKILQDTQTISDLKLLPGEIVPDRLVTLHLVIAAPGQVTGTTSRRKSSDNAEPSCCCIQ